MPRLTLLPLSGHPHSRTGRGDEAQGLAVEVEAGVRVLDAASHVGFLIATRCGGIADCRACRVRPEAGAAAALSPVTDDEREALAAAGAADGERLACQALVLADVRVYVPDPASVEEE